MPSRLVSVFSPEEVQAGNVICRRRQTNNIDSVMFKCNQDYRIRVQLAEVGSRHWFDVIVNIAELDDEKAREAIAIATKLALAIEENIKEILFKYEKSLFSWLSGLSFSLAARLPAINIEVQRREEERQRRAQKSAPNTLSVNIGRFVNLIITNKRTEEEEWVIE